MEFKSILSFKTSLAFRHFDCGNENLNKYIRSHAQLNDQNNLSKTFICLEKDDVVGFVTLCNSQIEFQEMPNSYKQSMPKYPVPAIKIARLAVDNDYQGQGYGKALLQFAFKKIIQVSVSTGVKIVVVDAKDSSKEFYERFGFIEIKENTYILMIDTLIDALISV